MSNFDYDWIVVGSGFGGSVSALRLAEKGYKVAVIECGREFKDDDFAKSTWNLRRYFWAPKLGMRGILRLTLFKDLLVASGSGVGGGSLVYANTLYVPPSKFFNDPQWQGLEADWETALKPFYDEAQRMLGVTQYVGECDSDRLIRSLGEDLGVGDTYTHTPVGIYFGEAGKTVSDPYFGGEGPDRTGCMRCGSCMMGCREGAKNTLVKNYLWFARKLGVEIIPNRTVTDITPLGNADGRAGYAITTERSGAWFRKSSKTLRAKGVIVSAGALGTNQLLARCKYGGSLPKISDRLGSLIRTNSEAILAVTAPDDSYDFTSSVAISSSVHPDENTHIENTSYGPNADSMSFLLTLLTPGGTRITRPLKFLAQVIRHPINFLKVTWPKNWSRRTMWLLVMQTLENSMRVVPKKKLFARSSADIRLQTEQDPENPNPTYIPIANQAASMIAAKIDGIAQSGTTEALFNIPSTAHFLGGAVIGKDAESGVIDADHHLFGYENLLVCDGSAIPANVGVNPSLTITAMTERAISKIPAKNLSGESRTEVTV